MFKDLPFTLPSLRAAYAAGARPEDILAEAYARLDAAEDPGVFIYDARAEAMAAAKALGAYDPAKPLWGVPFAVKDNIDVAGLPTTCACPDAEVMAETDAFVVAQLKAAGAIVMGKTNLDQFATGLVGVRSPYPIPKNALDPSIVPGGSSSGSGVIVGLGACAFSLGTDTAGSGRVPAALNGIVGLKPSLGAFSASGMAPACRTLDTISVFALTVEDAFAVFSVAAVYDAEDAYSRPFPAPRRSPAPPAPKIAVPDAGSLKTDGDAVQAESFRGTVTALRTAGAEVRELDFSPFYEVAELLYYGAWVAERTAALGPRLTEKPETLHPTTLKIVGGGLGLSAVDAFNGIYRLAELRRKCEELWAEFDLLAVPTIPRFATVAELEADPIGPNSMLGTYTNFVNLLDMAGIAVPTGSRGDGRPGSVTLLGRAGADALLAAVGMLVEAGPMGATPWARPAPAPLDPLAVGAEEIALAVCGAHMSGLPLNPQLTSRGGRFLAAVRSAPDYRMYALAGGPPARPGMVRRPGAGASIPLEVWAMPKAAMGELLSLIPAPLGLGTVFLSDGRGVCGFLCEEAGLAGAEDITALGGWRAFLAAPAAAG